MNCFFSIGPLVGHSKKTQEAVAAVPAERLMLETDAPDQFCSHEMDKLKWLVEKAADDGIPIPPVRENQNPFASGCCKTEEDLQADTGDGKKVKKNKDLYLNEPGRIPFFAVAAAHFRGSSLEETARLAWENAEKVYFSDVSTAGHGAR